MRGQQRRNARARSSGVSNRFDEDDAVANDNHIALWQAAALRLRLSNDPKTAGMFGNQGKTLAYISSVADIKLHISASQYVRQKNGTYIATDERQDDGSQVPLYKFLRPSIRSRCDQNGILDYDDNFLGYAVFAHPDDTLPQTIDLKVSVKFANVAQARATLAGRSPEELEEEEQRIAKGEVLGRAGSGEAFTLPRDIGDCQIRIALPNLKERTPVDRGALLDGDEFRQFEYTCTLAHTDNGGGSIPIGEFAFRFAFIRRSSTKKTHCIKGYEMCEEFVDTIDDYKKVFFQSVGVKVNKWFDIDDESSGENLYPRYNLKPTYVEYKARRQLLYSREAVAGDEAMNLFVRFTGAVKFKFSTLPTFVPSVIRETFNVQVSGSVQARAQFNFGTKLVDLPDSAGVVKQRLIYEDSGWVLLAAFNIAFKIPLGDLFALSVSATRIGNAKAIRIYTLSLSCQVPPGAPGDLAIAHMAQHLSVTLVPMVLDAVRIFHAAWDNGTALSEGRKAISTLARAAKTQFLEVSLMIGWTIAAALSATMTSSVSLVFNVLSSKLNDNVQAMDVSMCLGADHSAGGTPPGFPFGIKVSYRRLWDLSNIALVTMCPRISVEDLDAIKNINKVSEDVEEDAEENGEEVEEGDPGGDE